MTTLRCHRGSSLPDSMGHSQGAQHPRNRLGLSLPGNRLSVDEERVGLGAISRSRLLILVKG